MKMFCKNLCDKVSRMKNLCSSWCNSFFSVDAFFTEKIKKRNRLFLLFLKKPKKGEKYGPKRGSKIEK